MPYTQPWAVEAFATARRAAPAPTDDVRAVTDYLRSIAPSAANAQTGGDDVRRYSRLTMPSRAPCTGFPSHHQNKTLNEFYLLTNGFV